MVNLAWQAGDRFYFHKVPETKDTAGSLGGLFFGQGGEPNGGSSLFGGSGAGILVTGSRCVPTEGEARQNLRTYSEIERKQSLLISNSSSILSSRRRTIFQTIFETILTTRRRASAGMGR